MRWFLGTERYRYEVNELSAVTPKPTQTSEPLLMVKVSTNLAQEINSSTTNNETDIGAQPNGRGWKQNGTDVRLRGGGGGPSVSNDEVRRERSISRSQGIITRMQTKKGAEFYSEIVNLF